MYPITLFKDALIPKMCSCGQSGRTAEVIDMQLSKLIFVFDVYIV